MKATAMALVVLIGAVLTTVFVMQHPTVAPVDGIRDCGDPAVQVALWSDDRANLLDTVGQHEAADGVRACVHDARIQLAIGGGFFGISLVAAALIAAVMELARPVPYYQQQRG